MTMNKIKDHLNSLFQQSRSIQTQFSTGSSLHIPPFYNTTGKMNQRNLPYFYTFPSASSIQVLHLNAALERHILSQISTEMIVQRALVDALMMIALAHIVKHTLHQQPHEIHNHQQPNEESTHHDPSQHPVIVPTVNHDRSENHIDHPTDSKVTENQNKTHAALPLQQLVALLHRSEAVNRLDNRHYASEMPQCADVYMDDQEHQEHDHHREQEQQNILRVDGDKEKPDKAQEDDIVHYHSEGNPKESDEQALEDAGDGGDGAGEGDRLGGVEGSDGEDDGGGGEEGESEEEDEVEELENKELRPVGGGGGGGVGLELREDRVSEERVS